MRFWERKCQSYFFDCRNLQEFKLFNQRRHKDRPYAASANLSAWSVEFPARRAVSLPAGIVDRLASSDPYEQGRGD